MNCQHKMNFGVVLWVVFGLLAQATGLCGGDGKDSRIPVSEYPADMHFVWKGSRQGREFLGLKQIQMLSTNVVLREEFSRFLRDRIESVPGGRGLMQMADLSSISSMISNDVYFWHWSASNKQGMSGWMVAVSEDDATVSPNFLDSSFESLFQHGVPELNVIDGDELRMGLSQSITVENHRWTTGRLGSWRHYSALKTPPDSNFSPGLFIERHMPRQSGPSSDHSDKTFGLFELAFQFSSYISPSFVSELGDKLRLPRMSIQGSVESGKVKLDGLMEFDEDVCLNLKPWKLPKEYLRDPITSLTAIRGVDTWLNFLHQATCDLVPQSDQIFLAGEYHGNLAYALRAVIPVQSEAAQFDKLNSHVHQFVEKNFGDNGLTKLVNDMDDKRISWSRLPVIVPYLRLLDSHPQNSFIEFGLLPIIAEMKEVPKELLDQITENDKLIAYDWELTPLRSNQFVSIFNVLEIIQFTSEIEKLTPATISKAPKAPNQRRFISVAKDIANACENTVTVITQEDDRHWRLRRSSNIGLNALEIAILAKIITQ